MNSCQVIQPPQQRPETTPKKDIHSVPKVTSTAASQPMDIESAITTDPISSNITTAVPTVLKKKKKTSYKAMMAAMTSSDAPRDIEMEKESIRKATGGGTFAKIDKI
jgi:hypothetical protein